MQLTFPSALFWLLLAIPLAALYLLKIRPRQQIVSTVRWWQHVIPDSLPRRWWQRLRHPLSLFIQLVLLALLVVALGEPYWRDREPERRLIVILDNSVSMQATDVRPNRLTLAKRQVRRLIDGLRGNDRMALVTAGTTARMALELTTHQRSLRRCLAAVPATDGPGRLAEAIRLAGRLPNPSADVQLVVVTDPGGRASLDLVPLSADVQWIICGTPTDNVAITQFQTRRQHVDPLGFECLVEVTSFAAEPRTCQLSVRLGDELIDVLPLELPPRQSVVRVLSYLSATGGAVSAMLDVDDALTADNRAVAWIVPRTPRSVTLVTTGNRYLEKVLAAIPLVDLQVGQSLPPHESRGRVTILHDVPVDALPAGRSMIVQPAVGGSLWQVGEALPEAVIGVQHRDSSLLTHLELEELSVVGARRLELPADAQVLAATLSGEPVYAIVPHPSGEVLVLNVDLREGDFAWRTAFPLLMSNAINWMVGQAPTFHASVRTGDVVSLDEWTPWPPESVGRLPSEDSTSQVGAVWQIETPTGQRRRAPMDQPFRQIGPLDQAGMWALWTAHGTPVEHSSSDSATASSSGTPDDSATWYLGCNVVNPQESDLRSGRSDASRLAGLNATGQPLWFYLITTALLLLAVEWWLYQRRWIS
jgi:hypothetical protein